MKVRSYKDLTVWQAAMDLVERVYALTRQFPKHEMYALTVQVQRSAVSVPSNIAEGHARRSTKEYERYVSIALGSLAELETQLLIAERLRYIRSEEIRQLLELADGIGKMLRGLGKALNTRQLRAVP